MCFWRAGDPFRFVVTSIAFGRRKTWRHRTEMIKPIAVGIALTFAPAAFAQTYIVADSDCGAITLHATRGADFPNLGETIGADRVKEAHVSNSPSPGKNPDRLRQRLAVKPAVGPRSLDFNANVAPEDGVVIASVDFTPAVSGNET